MQGQWQRWRCISVKAVHNLQYWSSPPFIIHLSQQGCCWDGRAHILCHPNAGTHQPPGQGRWQQQMIMLWVAICLLKHCNRTFCLWVSHQPVITSDLVPMVFPPMWYFLSRPNTSGTSGHLRKSSQTFKIMNPNSEWPKFKRLSENLQWISKSYSKPVGKSLCSMVLRGRWLHA